MKLLDDMKKRTDEIVKELIIQYSNGECGDALAYEYHQLMKRIDQIQSTLNLIQPRKK